MIWTPHVTVAAVVEEQGRYLMVEELVNGGQVFNQPAGHLEEGESLVQAIQREVMEETARVFEPSGLCGIYRWQMAGLERTYLRFCFTGSVSEQKPGIALDEEIIDTHWLTYSEVSSRLSSLRSPMVLQCIRDFVRGDHIALDLLHDIH